MVDLDDFGQGVNDYDEAMTTSLSYGGASAVDGGVECPGTTALTCLTTGNGPSAATAAWGGGGSWSSTTLSGVTNLYQVACTSATYPTCVGVGDGPGGAVILTTNSDLGSHSTDLVPTGPSGQQITDLTQVTCPSTADGCYALGTTATGARCLLARRGRSRPRRGRYAWAATARRHVPQPTSPRSRARRPLRRPLRAR